MSAPSGTEVKIHWTKLTGLRETARHRIESRLQELAAGHHDLLDIHIAAHDTPGAGHEVKITCSVRGHAITVAQEHARVGNALHGVLEDFEREVHRLRDRRQGKRRLLPDRPEPEPPNLEL